MARATSGPRVTVLDASAVLAVLFREPGAEFVIRRAQGAAMSAINYAEVIARVVQEGFDPVAADREIVRLRFDIVPFDRSLAHRSGVLRAETRALGLSLGDRACLALAERLGGTVLTGDRHWARLDLGIPIELIR